MNHLIFKEAWNARNIISNKLVKKYSELDYEKLIENKFGKLVNSVTIECTRFANIIRLYFDIIVKLILLFILILFLLSNYIYFSLIIISINLILYFLLKNKISSFAKNIGERRLEYTQKHTSTVSNIFNSLEEAKIWNFEKKTM